MQKGRKSSVATLIFLIFSAAFIWLFWQALGLNPNKVSSVQVEQEARDFRVTWLQGREFVQNSSENHFRLQDIGEKPLVLNFFASWCVSCREEAKYLETFWKQHKDSGVMVVGIAIHDKAETAMRFVRYFGKSYPIGLDEEGAAAIDYGVSGVPETFFIDRKGVIKHKEAGPVDPKMLTKFYDLIK